MSDVLRRCIREMILEVERNKHVPNQLVSTGSPKGDGKEEEKNSDEVDEMSVVANIVGPMLPFGAKTPGKKKEPGWK